MKWTNIEVGGVYRSKNGLCRKVIGFEKWQNRELVPAKQIEGNEVAYVPCDEMGNPKGEKSHCWYMSFASWAKERLESDGRTPIQRVQEFQENLRNAGRAYCADYIDEAFRLYGIELPQAIGTTE